MANYRHTIEVEARFVDNLSGEADSASRSISSIGKAAKKAKEDVNKLGKADATPDVGLDTSKFTQSMDKVNRLLDKIKKMHTVALNIKDSGTYKTLKKITDTVEGLTRKTWNVVVKVKDIALTPFRAVRNAIFSIQTLATAVFAGIAAKTAIMNPINVADAYSSAKIGFSTLLGESGGQQMMDQLDAFAKRTPFKTTNVIANAQKMMAMGWGTDTLIEDMEVIGNAAAATGKLDQGLESIVRALSQIKTKGKLSSEELNQLSEAGIAAKAMLAEQLGYGAGDEGIAKMAKDLEKGAIGSDKAIKALLAGMKKYDGMMDSMANETVEGLISQIGDAFEISVVRKWGQGLQDGAKRGFGTVIELLDKSEAALAEFGDMLYEIGHNISNWVADKFEETVSRIIEITGTAEFENASLKEKFSMLWNGVIVDPLREWWEGGGREKTVKTAGEVGAWIGKTLNDSLLYLFGITDGLEEGADSNAVIDIVKSFSDGFRENFDASVVTEKLVEAIGNVWGALPTWAKVLLGVYGGSKVALGGMNLFGGAASAAGSVGGAIGSAAGMTGVLGFGTKAAIGLGAGNLAGGASLGAGALSALGLGATAGGIAGAVSAGKGIYDLYGSYKAFKAGDKIEGKAKAASGGTALGGVGAGAAAGAAIGSVIPGLGTAVGALIGAGVGGIAGWIGGEAWAKNIRAAKEDIERMADEASSISTEFGTVLSDQIATMEDELAVKVENLKLLFPEGSEEYDTALQMLVDSHVASVDNVRAEVVNLELDLLGDAYAQKLGDDAAQKLRTVLEYSINNNIDPITINDATLAKMLDIAPKNLDGTTANNIKNMISGLVSHAGGLVSQQTFTVSPLVDISPRVRHVNTIDTSKFRLMRFRGGFVGGGSSAIEGFADGGFVRGGARLVTVAEEGTPEVIIPLGSHRRARGLELWKKAGEMLGIKNYGRMVSGSGDQGIRNHAYSGGTREISNTAQVNLGGVSVSIQVDASNSANVAEVIKAQSGEIAETVASMIAAELGAQFENTPAKGGVA